MDLCFHNEHLVTESFTVICSTIHATAIVSPAASIGNRVHIGPHCVIDGAAVIEDDVQLEGQVLIRGRTQIGAGSRLGWGTVVGGDPQDLSFDPSTHSGVILGPRNTLREHVTIHRSARPGGNTTLGADNFLMSGSHVGHDVNLGDHNVIANNVMLAGHIHMGSHCFLGGGAGFHQGIRIGDYCIIQGNAAISQDVPPYCMAHGQNQLAGLNVIGLRRAGFDSATRDEIKRVFRQLCCQGNRTLALASLETVPLSSTALKLIEAYRAPSRKGIISRSSS